MIKIGKHYISRYNIEYAIFKRIAKFKKCKSCFRCRSSRYYGFWDISIKPKKGDKVKCSSACSPDIDNMNHKACEWYEPRWYWNLHTRYEKMRYSVGRWYCEHIRMPIGSLRKPVPLEWVDGLNACGELEPMSEPRCPHCKEMPYSLDQCVFCGQRFLKGGENP